MDLTAAALPAYLRARGIAPVAGDVEVRPLSGGVSNVVLLACWDGGGVVVKQSLDRLRVATEWRFDRARILVERACLDTLGDLLPGAAPAVVFADDVDFVLGMTVAPDGGEVWRDALHAGRYDPGATLAAARLLGRLQATSAAAADRLTGRFADQMPLVQGRIDPFHRAVAAAHPELAPRIEAEVRRLLATRTVLAHGDFSPKNLIAYAGGPGAARAAAPDTGAARMVLLDCECAHWGDPAFDVAFLLCHLLADGCHDPAVLPVAATHARRFWDAYRQAGGCAHDEHAVVAELGCILLARADGKSPLPGLCEERRRGLREAGRRLLLDADRLAVGDAVDRAAALIRDPGGP
ncbi:MAG TPA: aminoglycoside phosphotransferase family protein [Solirubrobacter sp.]|nr:aminoglycoside phosphotransferase family protein [Solirubrobacter sp.]